MDEEKVYELLKIIEEETQNSELIDSIKEDLKEKDIDSAIKKISTFFSQKNSEDEEKKYSKIGDNYNEDDEDYEDVKDDYIEDKGGERGIDGWYNSYEDNELEEWNQENENNEEKDVEENYIEDEKENEKKEWNNPYPKELRNEKLENSFIGVLLNDPKLMAKLYLKSDECYFENELLLEIYKGIVFTEGEAYTPNFVKNGFNFGKNNYSINMLKSKLKEEHEFNRRNVEDIYLELKKLFILRKNYLSMPIRSIQDSIVQIIKYELYDQMSEQEVENAVNQVTVTDKFKQSILSEDLADFFIKGENNLREGIPLPFTIISSSFKGIRRGETSAWAMPSNAGKSRFTTNLAAYMALVHKKKTLVISNEMSEEKMKLCLITTILNNNAFQELHGKKIKKSEGELLEFKFRPDDANGTEVDDDGFVIKKENENQKDFVKRLEKISSEYRDTIEAMEWANDQIENKIYFVNITDHTNDELQKIIMNYYYRYNIHYMFYDTLKTDTANIGNGEEIKRTTTILSNLAQNFNIYIGATLQLRESETLPVNLTINDLAVSGTVKEVLDTLCLVKQINRDNLNDYEYSLKEVDTKFFDLEKFDDPDVRYYACVVDKNRAGAKPKVLFRLNLAYNHWEELGYLRLKQKNNK